MLTSGIKLGPYEILSPLGAGGMGEVFRARDSRLGREVALKILPVGYSADPDRLRRFEQEARATAALNHPNILAVFDVGQQEGSPYIVSELLEGESLRASYTPGRCRCGRLSNTRCRSSARLDITRKIFRIITPPAPTVCSIGYRDGIRIRVNVLVKETPPHGRFHRA